MDLCWVVHQGFWTLENLRNRKTDWSFLLGNEAEALPVPNTCDPHTVNVYLWDTWTAKATFQTKKKS